MALTAQPPAGDKAHAVKIEALTPPWTMRAWVRFLI